MTEPKKYGIIVVDIEDDKITDAQYKITDVDAEPKPDTTTGYSPIDIKDLATVSTTAVPGAVLSASPTAPSALPVTGTMPSKTENTWPKELEPATFENLKDKGIFYLVKKNEVNTREKITIIELLKKISPNLEGDELTSHNNAKTAAQKKSDEAKTAITNGETKLKDAETRKDQAEIDAAKAELEKAKAESEAAAKVLAKYNTDKDYKAGIEKLLFRKIDIDNVQRTALGRVALIGTMAKKALTRENTIPKSIQVDFKIPGKINTTIKTTVTTEGKVDDLLNVTIPGVASLEGEYVIYKPVDINVFDLANLVSDSKDPDQEQIGEALNLITTSTLGGAKKLSKKNNLKTKNRRNRSKRKSLKRITRKIKRT